MIPVFLFLLFLSMTAAPLRAADSENQIDEDPDVTEIISKANANIKTPLIFGDIAPSRKRNADPCTAKGCKWPKTGDYVYIPVQISSSYTPEERRVIFSGLESFHNKTCIRFILWNKHTDYVHIKSGPGCWSYLGRRGGKQLVYLNNTECLYRSAVQHEFIHVLGFHHEINRSDRDTYVRILKKNIEPGKENQFKLAQTNNLGTPYDFNSVMHYSNFAHSGNGRPTILSKANPVLKFGWASKMSDNDIARINILYECS